MGEMSDRFQALGVGRRRPAQSDHAIAHAFAHALGNPPFGRDRFSRTIVIEPKDFKACLSDWNLILLHAQEYSCVSTGVIARDQNLTQIAEHAAEISFLALRKPDAV